MSAGLAHLSTAHSTSSQAVDVSTIEPASANLIDYNILFLDFACAEAFGKFTSDFNLTIEGDKAFDNGPCVDTPKNFLESFLPGFSSYLIDASGNTTNVHMRVFKDAGCDLEGPVYGILSLETLQEQRQLFQSVGSAQLVRFPQNSKPTLT